MCLSVVVVAKSLIYSLCAPVFVPGSAGITFAREEAKRGSVAAVAAAEKEPEALFLSFSAQLLPDYYISLEAKGNLH